jgi:hypothetical protein
MNSQLSQISTTGYVQLVKQFHYEVILSSHKKLIIKQFAQLQVVYNHTELHQACR